MLMRFVRERSAAVTVDWVVLTAAVVGIGLAALTAVSQGTDSVARAVDAELSEPPRRSTASNDRTSDPINTSDGGQDMYTPPSGAPASDPAQDPSGGDGDAGGSGGGSGGGNSGGGNSGGGNSGGGNSGNNSGNSGNNAGGNSGNSGGAGGGGGGNSGGGNNGGGNNGGGNNAGGNSASGNSQNAGGGNNAAGRGSDSREDDDQQVDFTFDDLDIGCWWGDRAVSNWMSFNFAANTPFTLRGEGNPTAQNAQGQHSSSGEVRWGTNIRVDIPPPGESRTVLMEVGDEVGSFTVSRAACP